MSYLEFDHIKNGDKCFCVNNRGIMCQTSEDGRLHVVTRALHDLSSKLRGEMVSAEMLHMHSRFNKMKLSNLFTCMRPSLKGAALYLSTANQSAALLLGLLYGCQVLVNSLLCVQGTVQSASC